MSKGGRLMSQWSNGLVRKQWVKFWGLQESVSDSVVYFSGKGQKWGRSSLRGPWCFHPNRSKNLDLNLHLIATNLISDRPVLPPLTLDETLWDSPAFSGSLEGNTDMPLQNTWSWNSLEEMLLGQCVQITLQVRGKFSTCSHLQKGELPADCSVLVPGAAKALPVCKYFPGQAVFWLFEVSCCCLHL